RPRGSLEHADDFAGLFSCDREGRPGTQVIGDVAIVTVPVIADGRHAAFDDRAGLTRTAEDPLVLGRLGGAVDVAGAEGVFLRIDAVLDESAVGADDPPAGPVDPADPAVLDLEERVVELHDDPAVAAAVDALPDAGAQPGEEASARAQVELEGLVDQV